MAEPVVCGTDTGLGNGDGFGLGDGVGVGIGVGVGVRLGDMVGDGLGEGARLLLAVVKTIVARLMKVRGMNSRMGRTAGISLSISQLLPLKCLKNSTWRRRFSASSRVLYGPPRLRLREAGPPKFLRVFSERT